MTQAARWSAPSATALADQLDELAERFQNALAGGPGSGQPGAIRLAITNLLSEAALPEGSGLARALARMSGLTEVWECRGAEPGDAADELGLFCVKAMTQLARSERRGETDDEIVEWIIEQSSASWGDYLSLLEVESQSSHSDPDLFLELEPEPDEAAPLSIDAQSLLRLFTGSNPGTTDKQPDAKASAPAPAAAPPAHAPAPAPLPTARPAAAQAPKPEAPRFIIPPLPRRIDMDEEIREAFLADATDLFERIESLVLAVGHGEDSREPLRELGRCFHTLKGASGSVGMTDLAALVHALEEHLEQAHAADPGLMEILHQTLAYLESLLTLLRTGSAGPSAGAENEAEGLRNHEPTPVDGPAAAPDEPAGEATSAGSATAAEGPVRVASARFDELMDLASELIARRRLWTGQAESLKTISTMVRNLRGRMQDCLDRLHEAGLGRDERSPARDRRVDVPGQLRKLSELDDDLAVLAETAAAAAAPLADHGDALGRLSMQLWDELQSIRIVPIKGLFQRLARVAHDAARVEGRQVDVVMVGENAGLDRAVQDKAFEPLLHVVRNSVGHGIEAPADRVKAGKATTGKIVLEARREGNSLVIVVQDDGRGLNHAAIEAKARAQGLLAAGETPTVEQLNNLIFQSGFSTRAQANAIAGRGVGMDVVAREVGLLRGTIELQTESGRGTRMTIRLPARLSLETVMILRVDGQAFALPVAQIEHAQPLDAGEAAGTAADKDGAAVHRFRDATIPLVRAREILGVSTTPAPAWPKLLVVRSAGGLIGLVVDAIEGTEELVIKPLNSLLAGHPLLSGTSMTVNGEVILVLNLSRLHGEVRARRAPAAGESGMNSPGGGHSVLVVDDSISVRRVVARHLKTMGLVVDEVSDGQEALGLLRARAYGLVVTDLEMPRLDGFGLLAEMKRMAPLASIPVIVASTRVDPETRQRVQSLGGRVFLPKPVDPLALAGAVDELLPRAGH